MRQSACLAADSVKAEAAVRRTRRRDQRCVAGGRSATAGAAEESSTLMRSTSASLEATSCIVSSSASHLGASSSSAALTARGADAPALPSSWRSRPRPRRSASRASAFSPSVADPDAGRTCRLPHGSSHAPPSWRMPTAAGVTAPCASPAPCRAHRPTATPWSTVRSVREPWWRANHGPVAFSSAKVPSSGHPKNKALLGSTGWRATAQSRAMCGSNPSV
jgi:hypothetical protein